MAHKPRCQADDCNEPTFYVNGPHCLRHINNPPAPKRQPARRPEPPSVAEESESSD